MTTVSAAGSLDAIGVVRPAARLRGRLELPSDKSVAHRALIFSAMAHGRAEVTLNRPGQDVRSTIRVLGAIGAVREVREAVGGRVVVSLDGGGTPTRARLPGPGNEILDCGNSGTTMRLLSGALAGRAATATLIGDASLSRRPMERVCGPLRAAGATAETTDGHAPLHITGAETLRAVDHVLPVASAQVLGAAVLAGLAADGRTTVRSPGPTRDHTERMLRWLGVTVARVDDLTTIDGPAGFDARAIVAPGDISSAAAWLVAGALHPDSELRLEGVGLNPTRLAIVDVLRSMGAEIDIEPSLGADAGSGPEPVGSLVVRGGRPLRAITIAGHQVADLIDELPLLGVAMAAADGTSELRDATELRHKESDRIALMVRNLAAIGADAEELSDGWRIRRGTPRDASVVTGGDHRIAMSFAVAALTGVAGTVTLDDPYCVDVSYAGFWDDLARVSA